MLIERMLIEEPMRNRGGQVYTNCEYHESSKYEFLAVYFSI